MSLAKEEGGDPDGDGRLDRYTRWAGTLPHWPLGLRAEGNDVLVATRGALLRLSDRDRDGWAERSRTLSDAWDVSRDHHDWTTGIAFWPGAGDGWVVCPVTDDVRARDVAGRHSLRGKALRVAPDGLTTVVAERLCSPTGWATRPRDGVIFFTDNQGRRARARGDRSRRLYRPYPLGIQEVKARRDGFALTFFAPPADPAAADPRRYLIRRYHHVFQGAYHSPPIDEEALHVASATLEPDGCTVHLVLKEPLVADQICELRTTLPEANPAVAHYTMNRVPR